MSAPRRKRTRALKKPGLTRRAFLRGLGLGAATMAGATALSGCGSDNNSTPVDARTNPNEVPTQKVSFLHSVASGDPTANSVMLWTRITPENTNRSVAGQVDVFKDEALTQTVKTLPFQTDASRDFTVKLDCTGLEADTIYFYQFLSNGVRSPKARTRTMPSTASKRALNLGVVSCSSLGHGFFNAYAQLAKRNDLDAIVHLGDYIYEYGTNEYGSVRPYEPANEITTLADYRMRHAQYKRDEDLAALHLKFPFITIWDDHESADNSYTEGANNHTEGAEGKWVDRKAFAQQAYDEWMPIRLPEPGNRNKIFRHIPLGGLADLFLLDTRLYDRDTPAGTPINPAEGNTSSTDRHMMGEEQYNFLINGLRQSQTPWKLVGNQVVFHQWILKPGVNNPAPGPVNDVLGPSGLNGDAWDSYGAERQRIINALKGADGGAAVNNVVILTGDVHSAWVADITDNPNLPISQAGGYNPLTGDGSVAVEFVVTSVTSPGLPIPDEVVQAIRLTSPHIKHVKMSERGYSLLKVTEDKVTCEYWAVSTITERGGSEQLSASFDVIKDSNRIQSGLPGLPGPLAGLLG
ncbi:alkaline phosphatase D family protein [Limnobacter humi]|uniref:Alkaline phosphatase D family protein n=1 Tax=Limnobacter humi TaxID=1778671 RepID=A0ABT1WFC4_9BURK|nr:alkaline phosphatase D family protein [Limnobacter humi]MCQ8895598.1 alkaline phosphatase D family protein [Limnobacter humi]